MTSAYELGTWSPPQGFPIRISLCLYPRRPAFGNRVGHVRTQDNDRAVAASAIVGGERALQNERKLH